MSYHLVNLYWGNIIYLNILRKKNGVDSELVEDDGIHIDTHDIEILSSGLGKIYERDMLMVFYVTVRHHGMMTQRIMLSMAECCEVIMDGDVDCDFVELYGTFVDNIAPQTTKNLSLYYPNLYGYNRKGWCLLDLRHHTPGKRDVITIRHRINFDTLLSTYPVPPELRELYDPRTIQKCDTSDLDPFDHCNPVICSIKYSGIRNYYNRKSKRCQKVPVCISEKIKDLPDIVYIPTINICRNVANAVTEEDISQIVQGLTEPKSNIEDQVVNIRCHHGEIDPQTGLCICDYGWKSEPFDPDLYNPHSVYSMCNIRCLPSIKPRTTPKLLYHLIGIFLALWLASCIMCFETWGCYCALRQKLRKKHQDISLYCTIKKEDAIEELDASGYAGVNEPRSHQAKTICNMCMNQCPRTVDSDYVSTKTGDDHSLWDISR